MSDIIWHGLLFFLSGFAMYWLEVTGKSSSGALFLLLALPVLGVYFLGWWAVLSYVVGLLYGAKIFVSAFFPKNNSLGDK